MSDRAEATASFLTEQGWAIGQGSPLAGDASARRYTRLIKPGGARAILMDADPALDSTLPAFLRVTSHLRDHGFSAPRVLGADPALGLVLLEDLGDALIARLCARDPGQEPALYEEVAAMLAALQEIAIPGDFDRHTPDRLGQMVAPAFTEYARSDAAAEFGARFAGIVAALPDAPEVFVHRDFHAENLVHLPGRDGPARIGLLDFQDAVAGHPAYDLASLTRDARRDLGDGVAGRAVSAYAAASGRDSADLDAALAVLGAQRNLRILGIFARLARVRGAARYLDLIPRVWDHLMTDLDHSALDPIRDDLRAALPEPTRPHLNSLIPRCPTPLTR